ncbi:MAG: LPS export ABC transporter ATP-binding protein [Chlorobi bacterium]|nr:MAG: LPS export ABC transporter ATP-binding protein [Bacteroidota bacterium]KXK35277.1 MAG: ABC transporter ATPase [Chlorobi bacterium OLB6]MBE2264916.1 LPS export ABC transporter ATP-binding protein [Flavobacteriales bacterium]MBL1160587.1 LPS export ABC transporter ATP-binding protein [Chlorobiota bacterium]MBW7853165.1 LPS export ABC transporter ATP-binding protein [Candidatus Kapabacteria bacterium]MCC6331346.1 LPS export ABC transporter ATP-binding protein [Ignavibacteria bacterium]
MTQGSTLKATALKKVYRKRVVVKESTLQVSQGEVVGLLGPNGAGKTTTFYMIVGMVRPEKGTVELDARNITRIPMYKRARMGLAYLPQEPSIFRMLSVEQNIMAVLQLRRMKSAERRNTLNQLIEEFGLTHIRKSKGYMLSGGERRRCEIARALATNPKFILLDEPFAGIDPLAVEDIMVIVRKLKEKGLGVLITDHNVHETLSITDRAYILIDGTMFINGTAEEVASNPEVRKLYLGEQFKLERY